MWPCVSCGWVNPGIKCGNCNRPRDAPAENVAFVAEKHDGKGHKSGQYRRLGGKLMKNIQTFSDGRPWA